MKRPFLSFVMLGLILLFMVLSPKYIIEAIKLGRQPFWYKEPEEFNGIIKMWHIVGFKAHTGSVSTWLSKRIASFEKKHFGIFIDLDAITLDEYVERRERGERADIYSVPLGLEYHDCFSIINPDLLTEEMGLTNPQILKTGYYGKGLYALPYMYSGYCLITNDNMLSGKAQLPKTFSSADITKIAEALKSGDRPAICGNQIIAAYYGIATPLGDYELFKTGNQPLAIEDYRAMGDIERRQGTKNSFTASAYAITSYTDLVQYIAFDKDIDNVKKSVSYQLIQELYTEKAQSSLADLNCYPVIQFDIESNLLNDYKSIAFEGFSIYKQPDVPNFFLYKRYKDALIEDSGLLLSGDKGARSRFNKRMEELLKNE